MTVRTFNAYHLGDQLVHLNFLHRLTRAHPELTAHHYAPARYLHELATAIAGIPRIILGSLDEGAQGHNAWRGVDGWWYRHPRRHDFVASHLDWFAELSRRLGVENPIRDRADLVFEFPALEQPAGEKCDVLIIDSMPMSNQLTGYAPAQFDGIAQKLAASGYAVVRTARCLHPSHLVEYGRMASGAALIVGVATGPMWLTIQPRAKFAERIILLDHERVEIFGHEHHCRSVAQAGQLLFAEGWL